MLINFRVTKPLSSNLKPKNQQKLIPSHPYSTILSLFLISLSLIFAIATHFITFVNLDRHVKSLLKVYVLNQFIVWYKGVANRGGESSHADKNNYKILRTSGRGRSAALAVQVKKFCQMHKLYTNVLDFFTYWHDIDIPYIGHFEEQSLYQSTSLSVSEFVCVFVCSLPLWNDEPQRAEILRDDPSWNWEGFRLKKHPDSSNR